MMKGTQAAVEAMFILQQHDNIQTVEVINLFLRPVVTYSGYAECVDVWNRIDWAALDAIASGFVGLTRFAVHFEQNQRLLFGDTWSAARQRLFQAAAEELRLGEKLPSLRRAKKAFMVVYNDKTELRRISHRMLT